MSGTLTITLFNGKDNYNKPVQNISKPARLLISAISGSFFSNIDSAKVAQLDNGRRPEVTPNTKASHGRFPFLPRVFPPACHCSPFFRPFAPLIVFSLLFSVSGNLEIFRSLRFTSRAICAEIPDSRVVGAGQH